MEERVELPGNDADLPASSVKRRCHAGIFAGDTFGSRTVGKIVGKDSRGRARWSWSCSCGENGVAFEYSLKDLRQRVIDGRSDGACIRCCAATTAVARSGRKRRCGQCGKLGHDRRSCEEQSVETRTKRKRGPCTRVDRSGAPCKREEFHNGNCDFR